MTGIIVHPRSGYTIALIRDASDDSTYPELRVMRIRMKLKVKMEKNREIGVNKIVAIAQRIEIKFYDATRQR